MTSVIRHWGYYKQYSLQDSFYTDDNNMTNISTFRSQLVVGIQHLSFPTVMPFVIFVSPAFVFAFFLSLSFPVLSVTAAVYLPCPSPPLLHGCSSSCLAVAALHLAQLLSSCFQISLIQKEIYLIIYSLLLNFVLYIKNRMTSQRSWVYQH